MKKRTDHPQCELFDTVLHDPTEERQARLLLDQLLAEAKLYAKGPELLGLLDFVSRLRNIAPFNALLLHIQRPGITYVASQSDWARQFGRRLGGDARPLLVLHPFGPVALVYDILDTEGPKLPEGVLFFTATGVMDDDSYAQIRARVEALGIELVHHDVGDRQAGHIQRRPNDPRQADRPPYVVRLNRLHGATIRFSTLVHELGHLLLGHLGEDARLGIEDRRMTPLEQRELEAEMAAYVICMRNGIRPNSARYLSKYVDDELSTEHLDLYRILRAVTRLEDVLGLARRATFQPMMQQSLPLKGGGLANRKRQQNLPQLPHLGSLGGKPPPRIN
jgi:hypothetical protein